MIITARSKSDIIIAVGIYEVSCSLIALIWELAALLFRVGRDSAASISEAKAERLRAARDKQDADAIVRCQQAAYPPDAEEECVVMLAPDRRSLPSPKIFASDR